MDRVHTYSSDIAFTPTVKAVQTRKGSRRSHARLPGHKYRLLSSVSVIDRSFHSRG